MILTCLVCGNSSSSTIAVSKMPVVMAVTSGVGVTSSSSSIMMTCDGSDDVVSLMATCCCYAVFMLVIAASFLALAAVFGLLVLITAVSFPVLVAVAIPPACGRSGPFWIKSAMSCWTSGVVVVP